LSISCLILEILFFFSLCPFDCHTKVLMIHHLSVNIPSEFCNPKFLKRHHACALCVHTLVFLPCVCIISILFWVDFHIPIPCIDWMTIFLLCFSVLFETKLFFLVKNIFCSFPIFQLKVWFSILYIKCICRSLMHALRGNSGKEHFGFCSS
jgi:hypothetical protein